jgi:MoaA/NifB/PqqE/SkfB family radical SAM enzyme
MLRVLTQIPSFKLFRTLGLPRMLPINLTVSLTYRCNSRCSTCRIYERQCQELTLGEYRKIFRSLNRSPYWITFSGGEPFLRPDIADICTEAYRSCRPGIINIPTNGMLPDQVEGGVRQILRACPKVALIINLSVDAIGDRHDRIRGVRGSFERVMETYRRLRTIRSDQLTVGFHTVISRFNAGAVPEIYSELKKLNPDSYITEIAERRAELQTENEDIAPSAADYSSAVDFVLADMKDWRMKGVAKITRAFRRRYYRLVESLLRGDRINLPCYAAVASCQIAPDGEVWACCIKSESLGNLRNSNYDFRKIWFSEGARALRTAIKARACSCPLANAAYTNMLFSLRTLIGIGREVVLGR